MVICMAYFGLCAGRQLVIVVLISFARKPQKASDFANLLFIGFDAIFISSLTIWGTMAQFDEAADGCRKSDDDWVLLMYIFSICCLLYGWIYVILLCCGLTSLPLIAIFWCFYRKQLNNMRGEMGVDSNQQRRTGATGAPARRESLAADPEVSEVVRSLKK